MHGSSIGWRRMLLAYRVSIVAASTRLLHRAKIADEEA